MRVCAKGRFVMSKTGKVRQMKKVEIVYCDE